MYLDVDLQEGERIAAVDDTGRQLSYQELIEESRSFYNQIGKRTLVFILANNSIESLVSYFACLNHSVVPLLLSSNIDKELLHALLNTYFPEYIWLPSSRLEEVGNHTVESQTVSYSLIKTTNETPQLNESLAMLLPTSGTTGSPKLVRHSLRNLSFSAESVSTFFEINPEACAVAFLPMYYTMGLSVINSHLKAGAKVVLTNYSLTDRLFWSAMKEHKVSTFTGVPYSFEILDKLRFTRMDLPALEIVTQGGGKLKGDLFLKFAEYATNTGKKFIPTYGQTEGSARMAYLDYSMVSKKAGSIGKAIPGGKLEVIDDNGDELMEPEVTGEMVYYGENVTLGYAESLEDLQKGDENKGYLKTGDIVKRDSDGYYFIIGRSKRFLKIYGLRIALDEVEHLVRTKFNLECICSGTDELLQIGIDDISQSEQVIDFVCQKTGLFHQSMSVQQLSELKRNEAGKIINS
jgi:long-chain acyl-CoA synthetase